MKYSTDFNRLENLGSCILFLRICVCSILLLSSLAVQTSQAQNCPSAQHNLQVAKDYQNQIKAELQAAIDEWNDEYADHFGSYEAGDSTDSESSSEETGSSSRKSKKIGSLVDVRIDNSGAEHYYVGIVDETGNLTGWKEVDYDPRDKKTSESKDSESSDSPTDALDLDALERQREADRKAVPAAKDKAFKVEPLEKSLALAQALVESVPEIPCDVYIKEINCHVSGMGAKECMVIFKNINDGFSVSQAKENQKLKAFYDALKKRIQASENRVEKNINPIAASKNSGEMNAAKNANRSNNLVQKDYGSPQKVFSENSDLSEISGKAVDENRDGKTDYVRVENADGTATTYYDEDEDGRLDWLAKENADGTSTLIIDTNNDGIPDKRVEIARDGSKTFLDLEPQKVSVSDNRKDISAEEPSNVNLSGSSKEISASMNIAGWQEFLKNQPTKPGEDGYVTRVRPFGINATEESRGPKNYFVNGVGNTYVDHRNSAQLMANALGQPMNSIYSESAIQPQNPESFLGGIKDVGKDVFDTPMMAEGGAGGASSAALSINVIENLLAGEKVRVFSHSRGAANVYGSVLYTQKVLDDMGKGGLMKNLEVITLGGYSPPAREWATQATIVNILNPGDAVPALKGQDGISGVLTSPYNVVVHTWHAHPVKSYLPWVEYIGQHGIDDVVRGQAATLKPPPNNSQKKK